MARWQLSAQGFTNQSYPWGDAWVEGAIPKRVTANQMGEPVSVGKHPLGRSAAGVEDLIGTIWQWTDSFCDMHTCRSIVRGGGTYAPIGSAWYFPWLELSESMDRSGGIGFRCAATTTGR